MRLHRLLAQKQLRPDLAIRKTIGDVLQHLQLTRRRRNLERTLTAIQRNHLATRLRRAGNLPPRRSLLEPASMAEVAIQNVLLLSSVHTKVIDPAASTL